MTEWAAPEIVDVLLAERRVLRALARALVADADLADDLVQEAVVEGGRRGGAVREARGFLAAVVRRRAANVRREQARRERRERTAARSEQVPSAAEMAARRELCRRVGDAVLALDEPYRTTVWLRYFDGLPPRAIARSMGVPVATVRTRVTRALARLRAILDREYGDRRAWAAVLLPCLGQGAGALGLLVLVGPMKKLLVALGAAALAAVVLWSWPFAGGAPPREEGAHAERVAAGAPTAPRQRTAVDVPQRTADDPPPALLEGRVVHDDGTPAPRLPFWVWGEERPAWMRPVDRARVLDVNRGTLPAADGTTDGEGRFALVPPAMPLAITFCLDQQFWVTFERRHDTATYVLPLLGTVTLTLEGWKPGDTWNAWLYSFAETKKGVEAETFSTRCIATRSGDAVLTEIAPAYGTRCTGPRVELPAVVGERYEAVVDANVLVFEPARMAVWCGETAAFRVAQRHPILEVRVVEPTGELARTVAGKVHHHGPGQTHAWSQTLHGGRAILRPRADLGLGLLTILTADGELLRAAVPPAPSEHVIVTLHRGEGTAPWRFALPEGVGREPIAAVSVEDASGWIQDANTFARQSFMDPNRREGVTWLPLDDRTLGVLTLAPNLDHVRVVLRDGRVAAGQFPGGNARGAPVQPLTLLPSRAFAPLDLRALAREHGARRGRIAWRIALPRMRGDAHWFCPEELDFEPWTRAWPVWEKHAPEGWDVQVMLWDFDRKGSFLPPPPPLRDHAK